ncbi:MAG: hypothetical protein KVP17_002538 [Porospora cf. gigantea B]|uniref:uncharacterized protein n=1 Tax=Porospora cf. gigantea B TaxID=2853592 RepID=UPI003571CA4A|nr:MAG: hypothetical protein KVP17_002538 [Porospora cf. gigantea B]
MHYNAFQTRERLISLLEQTHRDYAALQNVWKLAPTDFLQGITSIKGSAFPLPCLRPNVPTADIADLSINLLTMSDADTLRIPSHLLFPDFRVSGFDKFHSQLESPTLATDGSCRKSGYRAPTPLQTWIAPPE